MLASLDTVESEDENALRYLIKMLYTVNYGSTCPDHMISLKKDFVDMILRNLDSKNGLVDETRYAAKSTINSVLFL